MLANYLIIRINIKRKGRSGGANYASFEEALAIMPRFPSPSIRGQKMKIIGIDVSKDYITLFDGESFFIYAE
ncbi:MAG: hypothetical protein ABGX27_03450, partial [Desulfurobacteriaceae bacterium]